MNNIKTDDIEDYQLIVGKQFATFTKKVNDFIKHNPGWVLYGSHSTSQVDGYLYHSQSFVKLKNSNITINFVKL